MMLLHFIVGGVCLIYSTYGYKMFFSHGISFTILLGCCTSIIISTTGQFGTEEWNYWYFREKAPKWDYVWKHLLIVDAQFGRLVPDPSKYLALLSTSCISSTAPTAISHGSESSVLPHVKA